MVVSQVSLLGAQIGKLLCCSQYSLKISAYLRSNWNARKKLST